MVLVLVKEVCDSCDPEAVDVMECDFGSVTDCGMNESHCTCGSEMAPEGNVTDGSMSAEPCEKAIPGLFSYGPTPALRIAAVALWCRSVINIAAVSRSTMPSLLASICSRAEVSMAMADLEGPAIGLGLGPARRFTSL